MGRCIYIHDVWHIRCVYRKRRHADEIWTEVHFVAAKHPVTISGKKRFRAWALRYYKSDGPLIGFRLLNVARGPFYLVVPTSSGGLGFLDISGRVVVKSGTS